MGPNGTIGAAFIFLACLAAQSESILGLGLAYGNDKRMKNEILEEGTVRGGGDHEGTVEGDDDVPGGETVPLSVLGELEEEVLLELEKSSVTSPLSVLDEFVVAGEVKTPS